LKNKYTNDNQRNCTITQITTAYNTYIYSKAISIASQNSLGHLVDHHGRWPRIRWPRSVIFAVRHRDDLRWLSSMLFLLLFLMLVVDVVVLLWLVVVVIFVDVVRCLGHQARHIGDLHRALHLARLICLREKSKDNRTNKPAQPNKAQSASKQIQILNNDKFPELDSTSWFPPRLDPPPCL
jgi:hypothetical protein